MSAVLARPPAPSLNELCALFAGDELTDGHPTHGLAVRICERARPVSALHLKQILYGDLPMDDVPLSHREILARAYTAWVCAGRPS